MQLHYVAHVTWNHRNQVFRKQKIWLIKFSISHRLVFSVIFEQSKVLSHLVI